VSGYSRAGIAFVNRCDLNIETDRFIYVFMSGADTPLGKSRMQINNNLPQLEMIMKTLIAAVAVSLAIASTAVPASANYVAPDATWQAKALSGSGY
jgi:hypothetical protein